MEFKAALDFVLRYEGTYSDDPDDPGGPTAFGVTQKTYDRYRYSLGLFPQDVFKSTPAEREAIYRGQYWDRCLCFQFPDPLPLVLFDAAVNLGPTAAVKFVQQAAGVKTDGVAGPKTILACQKDPDQIAATALDLREQHYGETAKPRFLKGLLRRVEDLRKVALG